MTGRPRQTHCKHGHSLHDAHIYITVDGYERRTCKACNARRARERYVPTGNPPGNPALQCHDERHPAAKLTNSTVRRIRRRVLVEGVSRKDVAASLGLNRNTVAEIVNGTSYAWVL